MAKIVVRRFDALGAILYTDNNKTAASARRYDSEMIPVRNLRIVWFYNINSKLRDVVITFIGLSLRILRFTNAQIIALSIKLVGLRILRFLLPIYPMVVWGEIASIFMMGVFVLFANVENRCPRVLKYRYNVVIYK